MHCRRFPGASISETFPSLAETIEESMQKIGRDPKRFGGLCGRWRTTSPVDRNQVGDPKRELPQAAEEGGADCIFVGSTDSQIASKDLFWAVFQRQSWREHIAR